MANQLAQDTEFLDDIKQLVDLDTEAYERLATQLAKADTFLGRSEISRIAAEAIGEGSDRIAQTINFIAGIVHDSDKEALDAVDELAKAIEKKSEQLDPSKRESVATRLRRLVAEPNGIAKQHKARELVSAIGGELDECRIICDIRPIFDQKRAQIDGAIPLSILHLEYTKPDGEFAVVEFQVTEKQIAEMGEKIEDAKLKLKIIKEHLESHDTPIPRTSATVSEEEK